MKMYGISGLGADQRVFKYLKLDCEFVPIDWITPFEKESIENYALRLAKVIDTNEEFSILGISFGGLVATEISKKLKPKLTVLISTVETNKELPTIYRLFGQTGIVDWMPKQLFDPPRFLAHWIFGTRRKKLLNAILDDTDLGFAKWAVQALLTWKNVEKISSPCLKISGTDDKLLPPTPSENTVLIENGEHFMIVDKAAEISEIVNDELDS
jgi:pimeloyl-ACP methyl ester carboxylesterase